MLTRLLQVGHVLNEGYSSKKSATINATPGSNAPAINHSAGLRPLSLAAFTVATAKTRIKARMLYAVGDMVCCNFNDVSDSRGANQQNEAPRVLRRRRPGNDRHIAINYELLLRRN